MRNCALHIQNKDQDVFDVQNRVIPAGVVAVSMDTGDFRFGDGQTPWRMLTRYNGGGDKADSSVGGYTGEGYSGPLHLAIFPDFPGDAENESTVNEYVPDSNVMVVTPDFIAFGNGVDSVGDLNTYSPPSDD